MTQRDLSETKEWMWLLAIFGLCSVVALWLVYSIPIVKELPEGTSTAVEYVVNATVARFGVPVVVFLLVASLSTALGHNKGDGRPRLDFAAKVCNFGAAMFSMGAVGCAFIVGVKLSA